MLVTAIVALAVTCLSAAALATVIPHSLFTDGAVLQQGMEVPVWGMAREGEQVTVRFRGQSVSSRAVKNIWKVKLAPMKAGGPFDMEISGEDNAVTLHDIMVGEVWIACGQSNMRLQIREMEHPDEVIAASKDPMLHMFMVPLKVADEVPSWSFVGEPITYEEKVAALGTIPEDTISWIESGPETIAEYSAAAYYFGRELAKTRDVPVGIIQASRGATRVEAWTSLNMLREVAASDPKHFRQVLDEPWDGTNYRATLYNAMIAPVVPYAVRGVIWYQGETNAPWAWHYRTLFPALIEDWRRAWNRKDMPFLFVQIAPWVINDPESPAFGSWPELREAQLLTSKTVPNTAMVVITDYGDRIDIHPKKKEPVGYRLALAARANVYGERIVWSGPVYESMKVEGGRVLLTFDHLDGGLEARDGELTGFTIAGADRIFVAAQAKIEGDKVVVWNSEVKEPIAVRFGWNDFPVVNLFNKAGLPATPFRTDDFPMKTAPKDLTEGKT